MPSKCTFALVLLFVLSACATSGGTGEVSEPQHEPAAADPNANGRGAPPSEPASGEETVGSIDDPTEGPSDEAEGEGDLPQPPVAADPPKAGEDAQAGQGARLLDGEAHRQLRAMVSTAYQHETFVDEAEGIFRFDCSGFLGYALGKSLPTRLQAVRRASVARPLAKHYHAFFAALPEAGGRDGWSRVTRASDLRPGDVIAWLKPVGLASRNTGHVMIVRAAPTRSTTRRDELLVQVTDSTASPHGGDTRAPSEHGLGSGTIGLLVDAKGAPVGYRWNGGVSKTAWSTEIALARP
jgi:hypothetical protein